MHIVPTSINKNASSHLANAHRISQEISTWASYQIHKIAGCACAGNAGNVFPHRRFKRKPLVSDPGMHHGTCMTHVPWCMSGSLTCGDGENVPGIPGACAPAILRIWQEAHGLCFDLFCCGYMPVEFNHILQGCFTGTGAIIRLLVWTSPQHHAQKARHQNSIVSKEWWCKHTQ